MKKKLKDMAVDERFIDDDGEEMLCGELSRYVYDSKGKKFEWSDCDKEYTTLSNISERDIGKPVRLRGSSSLRGTLLAVDGEWVWVKCNSPGTYSIRDWELDQ